MNNDRDGAINRAIPPQSETGRIPLWPFALVIIVHMVGVYLPVTHAWGFNYWGLFPRSASVVLLILALVILLPPIRRYVSDGLAVMFGVLSHVAGRINRFVFGLLVSIMLFAVFFLFRVEAHVYGDGFTRLTGAANLAGPQLYGKLYLEGAAVLLGHYSVRLFGSLFGLSAATGFAISSCVGGVVGVWAIYAIAGSLISDRRHRWLILAGAFSSAAVILFFGYIESYTWATAVGLWSLHWSIKHARAESPWWPAVVLSLVATVFHMIALTYLGVAVCAIVVRIAANHRTDLRRLGLFVGIAAVAGSIALASIVQFTGLPQVLVPLWPLERIPYWFLDSAHLFDVANVLIQAAPLGLVAVLSLVSSRRSKRQPTPTQLVLGGAALFTFLASFWIDPEIGAMRDWDLLSVYGIPVSLWAIYRLSRTGHPGVAVSGLSAAVVVLALVTVVPNLIEKNDLQTAVARLDENLWQDIHYQGQYKEAERCYPWGVVLRNELDDLERPLKYFRRRLQTKVDAVDVCVNLGELHARRGDDDSARYYLRRVTQADPANAYLLSMLGGLEANLGDTCEAVTCYRRAIELRPDVYRIATLLGVLYYHERKIDSAYLFLRRGLTGEGYDLVTEEVLGIYCLSAAIVGRSDEAEDALKKLEQSRPDAPEIKRLRKMFDESDTTRSRKK